MTLKFAMHGCNEILESFQNRPEFLHEHVSLIESAIENKNPALAVDLAKSLVETICETILTDRGVEIPRDWKRNTPLFFEKTLQQLDLIPSDNSSNRNVDLGLNNTLTGLQDAVKGLQDAVRGLCEIRNAGGIASHGKDAYTKLIDISQAIFAAHAADSIVHFLYTQHKKLGFDYRKGRLVFEEHHKFNDYLDELYGKIEIEGIPFTVSQLLFSVDEEAYRNSLIQFEQVKDELLEGEIPEPETTPEETVESQPEELESQQPDKIEVQPEVRELEGMSIPELLVEGATLSDQTLERLTSALEADIQANTSLDWATSESKRANLRVSLKRTLREYEYPNDKIDQVVEALTSIAETST